MSAVIGSSVSDGTLSIDNSSSSGSSSDSGSDYSVSGSELSLGSASTPVSSSQASTQSSESAEEDEAEDMEEQHEIQRQIEEAGLPEEHSGVDLDAWNVTVSPHDLVTIFGQMTPVQLASYNLNRPKDVPLYDDWTLVAMVNSRLYVSPDQCSALVEAIQMQGHTIIPNTNSTLVLIKGHAHMSVGNLAAAMEVADIDAVRVTGYGMKHLF